MGGEGEGEKSQRSNGVMRLPCCSVTRAAQQHHTPTVRYQTSPHSMQLSTTGKSICIRTYLMTLC